MACGVNSSSSQSTSTSSYAAVSSITLSAAAETLEQISTSLQKVTVSATLNSGVNPAQELEWYVNGTKSSQAGKSFEYTPTAVGEYAIVAKVGSVSSNTVTVKVAAQGDTLKITLSKDGASKTTSYLYDTRSLEVSAVSGATKGADGSYTVVKPYAAAGEANKAYQISVDTKDISGANLKFVTSTKVPEGATAIQDTQSLVTLSDEDSVSSVNFAVTKSTIVGDYVHTLTVSAKSVEVTIHVVEPEAKIGLSNAQDYGEDDETTVAIEKYYPEYDGDGIDAAADGSFSITKPFDTVGQKSFKFTFIGQYFAKDEYLDNTYTISLVGPSLYGGESSALYGGIETTSTGTAAAVNDLSGTNYNYKVFENASKTAFEREVTQIITKDTPAGKYTFTIKADRTGESYSIVINVKEPTASLSGSIQTIEESSGRQIEYVLDKDTNTYTFEKPILAGTTYSYSFGFILKNAQSGLASDADTLADSTSMNASRFSNNVFNMTATAKNDGYDQLLATSALGDQFDVLPTNYNLYAKTLGKATNYTSVANSNSATTAVVAGKYYYEATGKILYVGVVDAATAVTINAHLTADTPTLKFVAKDADMVAFAGQTTDPAKAVLFANTNTVQLNYQYQIGDIVKYGDDYYVLGTAKLFTTALAAVADLGTATKLTDQQIADYTAWNTENITIFGANNGSGNRVFNNYTYTESSASVGTSSVAGKYAIQLAANDTDLLVYFTRLCLYI
ncbi:MAG: hypothetical protein PHY11_00720 [Bacilli bacterium]|nr:hypothetical protein [Bacilli bacterium]